MPSSRRHIYQPLDLSTLSVAASDPQKFGNLGVLPTEVRLNIWSRLGSHAPMMRAANRQIHFEIDSFIYDNLCVILDIQDPRYISATTDSEIALKPVSLQSSGFPRWAKDIKFLRKIKSLKFILRAPSANDPGQLIQSWSAMTRLINRIARKIKVLPQIRVRVVQDETRSWCTEDAWNRYWSAHEKDASEQMEIENRIRSTEPTDLEIALCPFLIDPRYGSVTVELPEDIHFSTSNTGHKSRLAENLFIGAPRNDTDKNTFVMQQVGAGPPGKPRGLLGCLRERGLHLKLDNMPGPTAAILRRVRFANWGKWYEMKQYGQAWHSWEPEDSNPSAIDGFEQEIEDFENLYREMRAWNPWSTFHFDECKKCARSDDRWEQEIRLKMEADQPLHIHQDGWYKKTWAKRYPEGIPPRNSQEYRDHVEKYEDPGMRDSIFLNEDGMGHEYADIVLPQRLGGWHKEMDDE